MSLSIVVNGGGTFTASMEEGPVSFTASLAAVGPQGPAGPGVAVGGTTGEVLAKASGTNYDTEWVARNPFDQSLNTTDTPTFDGLISTGLFSAQVGIATSAIVCSDITFPDTTTQSTALPSGIADGYIVAWNADNSAYDSVPNDARTLFLVARNNTGTTIAKGKAVYISGSTGNQPEITLAIATSETTSARTIGITSEAIANNGTGRVIVAGLLENVDTSAFSAGDVLYLSSSSAGGFQTTLPTQPNHGVLLGYVTRSNNSTGVIEVRVDNYQELGEQSDVLLTSKANGDFLVYESATSLWKNRTLASLDLLTATAAAAVYQPLSGMGSYLTTSAAASTYAPIASPTFTGTVTIPAGASISGFALLASPVFTGVPEAPTAAATTNTTQVATTAFVQQEVPAASTSAAGKVELATDAEALTKTDATRSISPSNLAQVLTHSNITRLAIAAFDTATSGTGGSNVASNGGLARQTNGPTSVGAGHVRAGMRVIPDRGAATTTSINWARAVRLSARIIRNASTPSDESIYRYVLGEIQSINTDDLAYRGIGIKVVGSGAMQIMAHDGTSLTNYTTTFTPALSQSFDLLLVSDGAGTVEAFVNGSSVGSTTGGPTTADSTTGRNYVNVRVENTSSFTSGPQLYQTYNICTDIVYA